MPPLTRISVPVALPRARVRSMKCDTDAMLGSASPRNPSVRIAPRSSGLAILLVAWRSIASRASSGSIPSPSSSTRSSFLPPSSIVTAIRVAPGVERVLDQLLDDRGGTLDDFAGGDLIGEMKREPVDPGHSAEMLIVELLNARFGRLVVTSAISNRQSAIR